MKTPTIKTDIAIIDFKDNINGGSIRLTADPLFKEDLERFGRLIPVAEYRRYTWELMVDVRYSFEEVVDYVKHLQARSEAYHSDTKKSSYVKC